MELNPQESQLNWNDEDIGLLRQFLKSRTGEKLVPKLAEAAPTLLDGGHANKTLVRNGELRGYQAALREIYSLAYPPPEPKPQTPAYPPLDADEHWEGEKLNEGPQKA